MSQDQQHQEPQLEESLRDRVIGAIRTVYDPEIPVDIYELGLIYEVRIIDGTQIHVVMTLTTPNCPSAQSLPAEVERVVREVEGVSSASLEITFDPPWDKTMMSEAALFSIGLF
ncbi:MAG: DUF59 domain-containing protein [Ignavibacteria bacterium]|nr:DUF59 domain-containing protein [Ignavibacteria bacterium]